MIPAQMPLITCVCVTKNRSNFLKKSIDCYLKQTYLNKKLVIVSQSDENNNLIISNYLKDLNRSDISLFVAPDTLSLGAMRNVAVELATGQIICQWDDDDLYHPERLTTQYKFLVADSRNVASLYSEFLKYFANFNDLYWCDWSNESEYSHRFLCGSIMFYKSLFHLWENFYPERGPQSDREEDLCVLEKLINKGHIAQVPNGNHYIYLYHGVNHVYDLDHHKLTLDTRWGKKIYNKQQLLDNQELIAKTLDYFDIDKVCVKSLDELAFEYKKSTKGIENEI